MVDFVVDRGLDRLRDQIDEAAPGRSKKSDGSIGDAAHRLRSSEHNPESPPAPGNPDNQVDARDFTHDPKHGADMGEIAEAIRLSRDRRVSYVIFHGRMFSSYSTPSRKAWEWGPYRGSDPHDEHMHISVNDQHHDETQDWTIRMPDSKQLTSTAWRLFALAQLKETIDNHVGDASEEQPFVTAFLQLCRDVREPREVTLTQEQLTWMTDRVAEKMIAHMISVQFTFSSDR